MITCIPYAVKCLGTIHNSWVSYQQGFLTRIMSVMLAEHSYTIIAKERCVGNIVILIFLLLLSGVCAVRADEITPTIIASGLNYPWGLVVDSTNAYWSDQTTGTGNSHQNIRKVGLNGGTITDLATNMDCPFTIAYDSNSIYWAECHSGNIKKVGINGGAVTTLATDAAYSDSGIAVDGTYIYFLNYDGGYVIKKMGINGGAFTNLVSGVTNPVILTQDGTYLYIADYPNLTVQSFAELCGQWQYIIIRLSAL